MAKILREAKTLESSPTFLPFTEVPTMRFPPKALDRESAWGPMSRRGWQTDGCLNELAYFQYVEFLFTTAPKRVDSVSCCENRGLSIEKGGTQQAA
jgi:hypothetical protein